MLPDTSITTFDFVLTTPISYDHQGQKVQGATLVLTAPSNLQKRWTTQLKQAFFQALSWHAANKTDAKQLADLNIESAGQSDMSPEQLLAVVFMSNVDAGNFVEAFRSLLLSPGICSVEGKQALTPILYDRLSDADTDRLTGEYLNVFFIGSLMKALSGE